MRRQKKRKQPSEDKKKDRKTETRQLEVKGQGLKRSNETRESVCLRERESLSTLMLRSKMGGSAGK